MGISPFPPRDGKILRTYHLIPPKFHLILPKKLVLPPWRIFIFHGAIWSFLQRNRNVSERLKLTSSPLGIIRGVQLTVSNESQVGSCVLFRTFVSDSGQTI